MPSKPRKADAPVKPATPVPAAASPAAAKPAGGTGPANASRRARAGLPSRAEQKRARLAEAKAELERKQRATRRRRLWIAAGVLAAVAALVLFDIFAIHHASRSKKPAAAIPSVPASTGTGRSSLPPWNAPADASAAVAAAGLPMLGEEGTAVHIHAHLDVVVNGKPVAVPADLGIDQAAQKLSPLHTHDATGIIHVESPAQANFTLGQFFTEWQVSLTPDQLGGLRPDGTNLLRVYLNGKPYTGAPGSVVLHAHDEIAVVYGTAAQQQNPPATYQFPSGL